MILELLAAIALGLGAAGFAMALRSITGGRVPRWTITAAAGIGMVGYTLYLDYSWGPRQLQDLPDGLTVVRQVESAAWWKPWTLVRPQLTRIAAVDAAGVMRNDAAPGMALTRLYVFDRHAPAGRAPMLVDCTRGLMAETADGFGFDAAGMPKAARWDALEDGDPIRDALCAPGTKAEG